MLVSKLGSSIRCEKIYSLEDGKVENWDASYCWTLEACELRHKLNFIVWNIYLLTCFVREN